ncbi:MAG TPA: class I SAM-dependent methyltransferase [Pyrinomonadaceae bacterium]
MSPSVRRRTTCRLCGGSDLEVVLPLKPTAIADAYVPASRLDEAQEVYPLDVFWCHDCGHLQLLDVIDPEVLFRDYIYVTSSSPGLVEHFRKYADSVLGFVGPPEGALAIDIGSNEGRLLRFFKERGMTVLGVDPAREIARQATESGIETLPAFFTSELARKVREERGPASIITANNVFAHADDLADMADGIRDLLAPDGVFVFEVSYLVDLMQNMVFDFIYHEHLCYHSVKALKAFFGRHGMELIGAERVPTKGGSLRGVAQLAGGPRAVSSAVPELVALEEGLGLDRAETFRAFARSIDEVKGQVLKLLREYKDQGKTIAGYGASATATTLVYHFELGELLSFIVDDYPDRQNLFSPGYHIPVLSPHALYERRPDCVVVLAWRFAEAIISKHEEYLARGGHFIVPLPEVKVI